MIQNSPNNKSKDWLIKRWFESIKSIRTLQTETTSILFTSFRENRRYHKKSWSLEKKLNKKAKISAQKIFQINIYLGNESQTQKMYTKNTKGIKAILIKLTKNHLGYILKNLFNFKKQKIIKFFYYLTQFSITFLLFQNMLVW